MLSQNVGDLLRNGGKTRASAEMLRWQIFVLEIDVREKEMLATMDTACVSALTHKLVCVSSMLAASRRKNVNSHCSASTVIKSESKVGDNVCNAPMAVTGTLPICLNRGSFSVG